MYDPILNPEKLLAQLGIKGNVTIADFGCGPGIFALPAATQTQGTVYAFDVLSSALEVLESKARTFNVGNVNVQRVNLEADKGSQLPSQHVDYVFMRKILLQSAQKEQLFAEAHRVLKPDGALLIVGWTEKATIGPDVSQRLSKEQVIALAEEKGFVLREELPTDQMHYALVFVKKSA